MSTWIVSSVELLAFAVWFGTSVWFSFISGPVSFRNMEKRAFGTLQSKLFPFYFVVGIICASILLFVSVVMSAKSWPPFLCFAGAITVIQSLLLGPFVTSTMERMYKLGEQDAKYASVRKRFLIGHGSSSLLNLLMVVSLAVHGVLNISKH